MKTDIRILGTGPVSQVLALLLARAGVSVNLSAHVAKPIDIRSFALNAASRQLLAELRAWPEHATPVEHMQVFGDTSGHIRFDAAHKPLAWIVDAADLLARLHAAISYAPGIQISASEDVVSAELTIICEGRVSQTRASTGAEIEQFAYSQHAVAAHVNCQMPHQNTAWQWMSPTQVCALLPRGESAEGNSMALVWSVPSEDAKAACKLSLKEFSQSLQEATQGKLGEVSLASERATWPLALTQAQQWFGQAAWGHWVLAGDAAHSLHPLAGQGLNLGLADAAELSRILSGKAYFRPYADSKLLRGYERARKSEAAALRLATDGLHRVFAMRDTSWRSLRNWGMQGLDGALPLKAWLIQQAAGAR